jgi:hypothetical protein
MDEELAIGAVNATKASVMEYLMHPQGGNLGRNQAQQLCAKYADDIEKGERLSSFANYVGDKILRAEGLPEGEGE